MTGWGLWDRLIDHAGRDGNHPAMIEMRTGRVLTYGTLIEAVNSLLKELPRGRVLLQSANTIEYVPRFIANLLIENDLLVAACGGGKSEIDGALEKTSHLQPCGGSVLLYSSGTTGLPKIVRRTRSSLDAVARNVVDAIGFCEIDRVIACVPIVHSYGMEHGLLSPLLAGATVLLCDGLNLPQIEQAIRSGATILPAVPSILELLSQTGDWSPHQLRRVYSAGAVLPETVAAAFTRRGGIGVGQVYGLTEVGSVVVADPHVHAPGTVGRPCRDVSVRIDPQNGEVLISAPSMLREYIGEPVELVDGHFRTGDLGTLTAGGELILSGRIKLLIDVGGAKVNPLEVEQVLQTHPQVAAAVVLPLRLSETICKVRAVVVPADDNHPPDPAELRRYVRQYLADYKVPRLIDLRDSIPRSPTGKILRYQLESS